MNKEQIQKLVRAANDHSLGAERTREQAREQLRKLNVRFTSRSETRLDPLHSTR